MSLGNICTKKIHITNIVSAMRAPPINTDTKRRHYGSPHVNELIYKIDGETYTHFNGKTLHILPDTIYILPKSEKARYYVDRVSFGDVFIVCFETDIDISDEAETTDAAANKNIKAMFEKLVKSWNGKGLGYYNSCLSLLYGILAELEKKDVGYLPSD